MVQVAQYPSPDEIAKTVLTKFDALPSRCKPRALTNGRREWVPLAGIVVIRDHNFESPLPETVAPHIECISIATGMKCLPRDKLPVASGNILHDWHAEVLAIRGFNRWIIDECQALVTDGDSVWLQWKKDWYEKEQSMPTSEGHPSIAARPFELKPGVDIHMYVSSAPCGDASMELVMATQSDATPWRAPQPSAAPDDMPGRAHFDQLGIVRRKPSRPDAPSTWSKSCSDKLSMKQCIGLLCGQTSRLVDPVYLNTLILPVDEVVRSAVQRAFSDEGRMKPLLQEDIQERWNQAGYVFRPFEITTTQHEFAFSKIASATSSNVAALWTTRQQEVLVNGVLMGRKQCDPRGASCVSRRHMWKALEKVSIAAGIPGIQALCDRPYSCAKHDMVRAMVKDDVKRMALLGWRRNDGDEDWMLHLG
ncbi:hypothetical protein AMS68_001002 [Peltaster fructicola]|uniref:A to I editase domain-containing protein n=1 Tax=Peltaster fructicola TaxID=286661 RepID=A0A6H0XLI1_9PEZI|nr:hypothetical protein AMS68_001002 [Peltaster fructicola]